MGEYMCVVITSLQFADVFCPAADAIDIFVLDFSDPTRSDVPQERDRVNVRPSTRLTQRATDLL